MTRYLQFRQRLTGLADATAVRKPIAKTRDRIVEVLDPGHRRSLAGRLNEIDDAHLRLLLSFSLHVNSNCLDVGANRGLFLREIQRVAPHGRHVAYEPLPELRDYLAQQFPAVEVRQCALSNEEGRSTFIHVKEFPALSGLRETTYSRPVTKETITVRTERLDNHLPEDWLPSFMKIDVEGAEALVIEGALHTICEAQPIIAFEHGGPAHQYGGTSSDIYRMLCDEAGLRIFDMNGNGPIGLGEFEDHNGRFNWIAHR